MKKSLMGAALLSMALVGTAQAQSIGTINDSRDMVFGVVGSGMQSGLGVAGGPVGDVLPIANGVALTGVEPAAILLPPFLNGDAPGLADLSLAPLLSDGTGALGGLAGVPQLDDTLAVGNRIILPILGGRR